MQHAVAMLAEKLSAAGLAGTADPIELDRSSQIIHGLGDIVAMLKLPATSHLYPREAVTIHPVRRPDGTRSGRTVMSRTVPAST